MASSKGVRTRLRGIRHWKCPHRLEPLETRVLMAADGVGAASGGVSHVAAVAHVVEDATRVADYRDDRSAALVLSFDTEMFLCGVHSLRGYDPEAAVVRAQNTRDGWGHILDDAEAVGIPVNFNICGMEAVFGNDGPAEFAEIDVLHPWHPDEHWHTSTWYSDAPTTGGNYLTQGELAGAMRSYNLIYGGDLTERTMNSSVPFEIAYHNFGHESLQNIDAQAMDATFQWGVEYHRRVGSKIRTQAPPWNHNPHASRYPIYVDNGIFTFHRREQAAREPYEVIENLWVIPRSTFFNVSTDIRGAIDDAIEAGHVLAPYSHPEDGFERESRPAFQNNLGYAQSKVEEGTLWATTADQIARYWEAKSHVDVHTQVVGDATLVDITLDNYDAELFGIPYLTFTSPLPTAAPQAMLTVDFPSPSILNSASPHVNMQGETEVTYTVFLNPGGTTRVEIFGAAEPFTGGVDINTPQLMVTPEPLDTVREGDDVLLKAQTESTDELFAVTVFYQINGGAKATLSMEPSATGWQVPLGIFDAGDVIDYYVAVTDNSGRRERSEPVQFTVQSADVDPPIWRNASQSVPQLRPGADNLLQAEGFDAHGLREARLETNESGQWLHRPEYGSPLNLGDVPQTWLPAEFTWSNSEQPQGSHVSWRMRFVDAAGNESLTEEKAFLIASSGLDLQPPTYEDPAVQLQRFGEPGTFSLRWEDNEALASYVFSFDAGDGTFVDDPLVPFVERAHSPWWDENWQYRRELTLDNTAHDVSFTNQPLLVTIDTQTLIAEGKLDARAGDLRFVGEGEELDFWIESGFDTAETRIWVRIPELMAASQQQVALYYGNPRRTVPQTDGASTLPLFDDFGGRGWEEFKYENNPIKGPGHPAGAGTFSSVLLDDDGIWKMYSSFDEDNRDIALSTSTDGLNWERQGVVLRKGERGEWDSLNTWAPVVWKEAGRYHMLHPASGPLGIRMGLATSEDGINWTKYDDPLTTEHPFAHSDPVFNDPVWATDDTESPCFSMVKEEDTYYVMYDTLRARRRASFASSTDLIHWTPVYQEPRFPGGESPADWNYNTFCGHTFAYEDEYYLILPGQDNLRNYAKFGLYVSESPVFPEHETEFEGIVMVGDQTGWESEDMDTPWVVQLDDKMHMYYAACGACHSETGVAIINDISSALTQAYPPGNYVALEREIAASQRIMPPVGWEKNIRGYQAVNGLNFEISLDTSISGRSAVLSDLNSEYPLELFRNVEAMDEGVISAWMHSSSAQTGDYDFYLYGDRQEELAIVAGLGGSGQFHYWDGRFVDTEVTYASDTWYRVEITFDTAADKYDFRVFDTNQIELVRVDDIDFGNVVTDGIDQVKLRTSLSYVGKAYADNVWARPIPEVAPTMTMSEEKTRSLTDAWVRHEKVIPFLFHGTMRWKVTAVDVNGNQTESEVFSHRARAVPLQDTPPTLTVVAPEVDAQESHQTPITFHGTCADERGVVDISLHGTWHEGLSPVAVQRTHSTVQTQVEGVFTEVVPEGAWEWHMSCTDTSGNASSSTSRSLLISQVQPHAPEFVPAQAADEIFAAPLSSPRDERAEGDVLSLILASFQSTARPLVTPVPAAEVPRAARPLTWAVLPPKRDEKTEPER